MMDAKAYLQQVSKLNKLIENKMIERAQWRSMATSTGTFSDGERVQSSGSQQKMADAVGRYVDIEKELDECIDRYIDTKNEVIRMIEQLPATEYDVLHKIYIQGKQLEDVADIYNRTYSWVTTVHGRALKAVQDMLDGKEQYDKDRKTIGKA